MLNLLNITEYKHFLHAVCFPLYIYIYKHNLEVKIKIKYNFSVKVYEPQHVQHSEVTMALCTIWIKEVDFRIFLFES
jgi:hypothetical protein